jgi:hypothetical protein
MFPSVILSEKKGAFSVMLVNTLSFKDDLDLINRLEIALKYLKEQSFATEENHRGTETRRNVDMKTKIRDPNAKENSRFLSLLLSFFFCLQFLLFSVPPCLLC